MYPTSTLNKKKDSVNSSATNMKKQVPKMTDERSKEELDKLMNGLDDIDAEEL
jgi:hypothetical protein